jgi:CheY-like chemotaxis protein
MKRIDEVTTAFSNPAAQLLVGEGNPDDLFFLKRALSSCHLLERATFAANSADLTAYLQAAIQPGNPNPPRLPKAILLDPALPLLFSLKLLEWLHAEPVLRQIPVVIFTDTDDPRIRSQASRLGAFLFSIKDPDVTVWPDTLRQIARAVDLLPAHNDPDLHSYGWLQAA